MSNTQADNLPSYLKSLESLIAGDNAQVTEVVGAPAATSTSEVSSTPSSVVTLSSIGFGTMFTKPPETADAANGKLKFLLVSTHVHQFTGYSKVSYWMLQELAKENWLDITHFGFQRHQGAQEHRKLPASIEVIDAASLEKPAQHGFGFGALPEVIRKKKPNVVMIYNDLAVVAQFIETIRKSGIPRNFQIWVYADQVYNTQNQMFLDMLNRDADRVFAFSPFWKKCLKEQTITRPIDTITHGFSPKQFFSIPRDLARAQLGLPKDMFLFLNLNRNQPRKRYDLLIMAFAELIVKYPTKPIFLLCICDKGEMGGWWLFELFSRELKMRGVPIEQFGSRLIVSSQNMSFKDEEINMFYNAADAGISTADGEGWGLCQFEQMGVGVPQVVPDIGGFKEFCSPSNSIMVHPKVRYYVPNAYSPVGGEANACDPHDICLGMEEYVLNSELREKHGKAAKEKVLQYTWQKSFETLIKRLREVKEDDE
jgi:glycosyltransferase involved in cell wall biosynthesis